jgi:hypothetical protein
LDTKKERERRKHFIKVPWDWYEKLKGATASTHRVALYLLYRHWKDKSAPIKLSNEALSTAGVPRETKRRALARK